jgi:hypothetical protein
MNKIENKNYVADQQGRRQILKTAVLGGAAAAVIPEKWAKPIVNTVMLPAHATTTDDVDSQTPEFPIGYKYSLSYNDDGLIPDPASLETAMNSSSLAEMLIPSAHAAPDFSSTTKFYLAHASGNQYQFSSSRTFSSTGNTYWAGGTLTLEQTTALDTRKNCGDVRLYRKQVELVSVDESKAVINVRLIFAPLEINEVIYTRTLLVDSSASPAVC